MARSERFELQTLRFEVWCLRRHSAVPVSQTIGPAVYKVEFVPLTGHRFQERITNARSGKVQGGYPQYFSLQGFNRKLSIRVRNRLALVTRNGVQNIGCKTVPPPQRPQAMAPTVTG